MVPRHAIGVARSNHPHHQPQHPRRVRPAIHQVSDEHSLSANTVCIDSSTLGITDEGVAELAQQLFEFGAAAVDVADDVEGAGLVGEVVVQPGPFDAHGIDLLDAVEDVNVPEPLALQAAQPPAKLLLLAPHDMRPELPIGSLRVPFERYPLGYIEDDGDREYVVLAGQRHQLLPRFRLHAGRVDHRQLAGGEPLGRDEVQHLERVLADRLVVLVVRDEAAAEVARDHLGAEEVLAREAGLARAAHADQYDEAQCWDVDPVHQIASCTGRRAASSRRNSASWVGGPTSGSSGPTARNETSYP